MLSQRRMVVLTRTHFSNDLKHEVSNTSSYADCRFMFEEPEGVVTSHRTFPFSNYDDNLDCSYVIRVGEGFRIRLAFIDFNTEKNMDYVTVSYQVLLSDVSEITRWGSIRYTMEPHGTT